jgi:hypothetical protein
MGISLHRSSRLASLDFLAFLAAGKGNVEEETTVLQFTS